MSQQARRYTRKKKVEEGLAPTPKHIKNIEIKPLSEAQAYYLDCLENSDVVFAIGCAGTGKTYVAAAYAAKLYTLNKIRTIVITRPNVAGGGRSLGHFPGDKDEKMMNWMGPVLRVLEEKLGKDKVRQMMASKEILMEPFETLRGASFDNAFVLLDEAQNASFDELKMFLTRQGQDSLYVVDGDIEQTDLGGRSGLGPVIDMIERQDLPVSVVEFDEDDIVRSDVCAMWIKAFRKEKGPEAIALRAVV